MLTQTDEIQNFLDKMMFQEEEKSNKLKTHIEELTKQLNAHSPSSDSKRQITHGEDVILHFGNNKFDKVIKSTATIDDLFGMAKVMIGTDTVGYRDRDDQGGTVWLRTTRDLHYMFVRYFSQKLPFMQIIAIQPKDIANISQFNLRKEIINKEDSAVFRCESAGSELPLIFLAIPSNFNQNDGFLYLKAIFGNFSSLMFVDEADDMITVDSEESWEYCIESGCSLPKAGRYPRLLVKTQ
ncbi:hypothetical protein TRFO_08602 [Tritrichomonas foetus]|uniref:Uncharacterized protein n=1 Tax=Tritrichomonas foetus TaxID=1144522 RepID=A0A1J4JNG0_9EUKA|nr:hypothetical protein TRFO_08602 [Tritrichomonas foetus]|eukprot:OHS99045.1 hypothetical protein TRFO_08602 [Tritrichomonas foetus]